VWVFYPQGGYVIINQKVALVFATAINAIGILIVVIILTLGLTGCLFQFAAREGNASADVSISSS
jgi:hypothetical protein